MNGDQMNDKNTQEELRLARSFLEQKLHKEKRSMKIRLVAGIVISVIVFGYMFWLSSALTKMGTPEFVREAFVTTIRSNAPEMVAMAKRQLLGNRKELVDFLTNEGVDKLVVVLMDEGRRSLERLISRITNETIGELNGKFVGVLSKDGSRLRTLLADPDKLHLEEELVRAFDDDLQESMGDLQLDEDFDEPLSKKLQESLEQLNIINDRLQAMAASKTLSRREILMVRFIKSWSGYVREAGDESPEPNARCNDGSPAEGVPPQCDPGKVRAAIGGQWKCVNPGTCLE
ncbi:MAG: hypothetical protein FJ109_11310 [Deltaproteobacteria bacterium]|nr:hypothetical protein [Deltaproteobacteria bacterium]